MDDQSRPLVSLSGGEFRETEVVRRLGSTDLARDPAKVARLLTPFYEAHSLGSRGYYGPEHRRTVEHLQRIGESVDELDEFDADGNHVLLDDD